MPDPRDQMEEDMQAIEASPRDDEQSEDDGDDEMEEEDDDESDASEDEEMVDAHNHEAARRAAPASKGEQVVKEALMSQVGFCLSPSNDGK
jgi:hypothetical protein